MRYLFTFLLFTACATARPQTLPSVELFFIDPVGKEYLLLTDGSLVTDNPLGQNRFAFFDSSLGRPDVVDVTNPFAILLYYADYGETIILDRTLSEIRRLDFFSIEGVEQPTTLARATDNGIWLFDSWDYRLKLMDQSAKISLTSNDLRLGLKIKTEPTAIYVYQNLVLLHFTEENRMAIFTNYGRFDRWAPIRSGEDFTWLDGRLAARNEGNRWVYDLRTNKTNNWFKDVNEQGQGARPQVPGEVEERWLPAANGFLRFNPETNKTEAVVFN